MGMKLSLLFIGILLISFVSAEDLLEIPNLLEKWILNDNEASYKKIKIKPMTTKTEEIEGRDFSWESDANSFWIDTGENLTENPLTEFHWNVSSLTTNISHCEQVNYETRCYYERIDFSSFRNKNNVTQNIEPHYDCYNISREEVCNLSYYLVSFNGTIVDLDPEIVDDYNVTTTAFFGQNTGIDANGDANLTVTSSNGTFSRVVDAWNQSTAFNLSEAVYWHNMSWNFSGGIPANVTMQVRTSNTTNEVYNASGLVGWWNMNQNSTATFGVTNIIDSSKNNGSINGNPVFKNNSDCYPFGDGCWDFDGTGDYVSVPDSADWDLPGAFSIELWWKTPSNLSDDKGHTFIGNGRATGLPPANQWTFDYRTSGTNRFQFEGGWTGSWAISENFPYSLDINTWYHIILLRDGSSNIKLYLNGVQIDTTKNDNSAVSGSTNPLTIATDENHGVNLTGILDSVKMYQGRALGEDEIKWNFFHTHPDNFTSYSIDLTNNVSTDLDSITGSTNARFIQYNASFTTNTSFTPTLSSVTFNYSNVSAAVPDNPPTITLNNPVNAFNSSSSTIVFNATGVDDRNVTNMSFILNATYNGTNSTPFNNTLTQFSRVLADGFYNWTVEVCDNSSQCVNATYRNVTIDTVSPTINVFSPTNDTFLVSTIFFNATADETIDTWILNYNGTNVTGFSINTTLQVEDGNFQLLLYANDSLGNLGLNDSIYFTVDVPVVSDNILELGNITSGNVVINFTKEGGGDFLGNVTSKFMCINCSLIDGDEVAKFNGNVNMTGNLTVKSINITSPSSINFLDVDNFIVRLFAQKISIPALGIERNVLSTDADSFGNNYDRAGTGTITSLNNNNESNSSVLISCFNNEAHGLSMLKRSSNYIQPNLGTLGNSFGDLEITSQNNLKHNISIVFFDDVNVTNAGDNLGLLNKTNVITINNKNFTIPFKTWFNFPVEFLNETIFRENVSINGKLDMNNNSIINILSTVYNISGCTDDTAGTLCYDTDFDTLRFVTTSGQVLQINQETTMPGKNIEGSNVADCSIVYIEGAIGINPTFKLAKADNFSTSGLIGVLTRDCNDNQVCPIVYFGMINEINTSMFTEGDHLYLSDSEAGNFTTTPPEFPSNPIWVATAIRIHETEGSVFVLPRLDSSNGITMNTLGLVGDFIQTDYKIKSLEGHANLNGKNVMCIEMNGTTGEDVCHLTLQPGGEEQASIWVRSGLVVPENLFCLNNTNRTDSNCYATKGGFTWNITDFNTTNTEGADWGITGELEVIKSIFGHENLTIIDTIFSNFIGSLANRISKIWTSGLDVEGNINQTNGNATINLIKGGMFFHNDTTGNVTALTEDVWENFTGFDQSENGQELNGLSYSNSVLTVLVSGQYDCDFGSTFTGTVNNKYHSTIGVNGVPQFSMEAHDRISTGSDILSSYGGWYLNLVIGDELTLMYMNENSGGDTTTLSAHVKCLRVGN